MISLTMQDVFIRLLVSVILGGLIGLERRYHDKPAGFTTNTLICIGATIFSMISLYSAQIFGGDPGRIAAQIVTGVGFLGAGSILRDGNKISGLTTAASIWVVSAVGIAAGYGNFILAAAGTFSVLIIQFFVRKLMDTFDNVRLYESITVKCSPDWSVVEKINYTITKNKAEILKQEVFKENGLFILNMTVNMSPRNFSATFKELLALEEIKALDK
jgi:putative Mg2+ transporter-C (MgtC) family protein